MWWRHCHFLFVSCFLSTLVTSSLADWIDNESSERKSSSFYLNMDACLFHNDPCVFSLNQSKVLLKSEKQDLNAGENKPHLTSYWSRPDLNNNQQTWAVRVVQHTSSIHQGQLPTMPLTPETAQEISKTNFSFETEFLKFKQVSNLPWEPVPLPHSQLLLVPLRHFESEAFILNGLACLQFRIKSNRYVSDSDSIHLTLLTEDPDNLLLLWSHHGGVGRWKQVQISLNFTGSSRLRFTGQVFLPEQIRSLYNVYRLRDIKIIPSCMMNGRSYNSRGVYKAGASPYSNFKCGWISLDSVRVPKVQLSIMTTNRSSLDWEVKATFISNTGFNVCVYKASYSEHGWTSTDVAVYWELSKASNSQSLNYTKSNVSVSSVPHSWSTVEPVCSGSYRCVQTGICIPNELVCNGLDDCPAGDDEFQACGEATSFIFAVVSASTAGLFAILFLYLYYIRIQLLDSDLYGENFDSEDRRYIELLETAIANTKCSKREAKIAVGVHQDRSGIDNSDL
ncbi:uncharacterized protein LOC144745032 [Ciona intestinalis]